MGIALKVFAIYMIVFLLILRRDHKKGKGKSYGRAYYFVPIGALVVIILLSVLKIFIVYKIIILLVSLMAVTLTYYHFRKK